MTDEELKAVKMAWARGELIQYKVKGGWWCDWGYDDMISLGSHEWRIKPKTIRIGDYDVPEPLRSFDGVSEFWVASLGGVYSTAIPSSLRALSLGLCHATREAAELHTRAILSFTEQK